MSSISMSVFSAYLIIQGLISVYVGSHENINFQIINYFVTALSIIQLVLFQYESGQDYKLRTERLHQCGFDVSQRTGITPGLVLLILQYKLKVKIQIYKSFDGFISFENYLF